MKREKDDKPLRKGICPNCLNKMLKRKSGDYHCMKCGWGVKDKR